MKDGYDPAHAILVAKLDGGKLVVENDKLYMHKLSVPEPVFSKTCTQPFGTPEVTVTEVETDGFNPCHAGVLRAFAGHILRGEPLVAPGQEGINGLTISNAMHLSSWLDKTIELPFDEDLFYEELQKRIATSRLKEGPSVISTVL